MFTCACVSQCHTELEVTPASPGLNHAASVREYTDTSDVQSAAEYCCVSSGSRSRHMGNRPCNSHAPENLLSQDMLVH